MRHLVTLWFFAASTLFLLCLYHLSAAFTGGQFIPADHDSFYHATRILGALDQPLAVEQFSARIHAPEGSWVVWPWAFDASMAAIASTVMRLTPIGDPMVALAFVAPLWVYVNAALLLLVGLRLRLPFSLLSLAMFCFAASALSRVLHRVGMLDHHFIEYSFVLALLYLGLWWFRDLSRLRPAILLGLVLGAAPAFHNGLFILQLPVLLTFGTLWFRGRELGYPSVRAFGLSLMLSTTLMLLPSEPFQQAMFVFYLHSWFHLYIALCTAIMLLALGRFKLRLTAIAMLIGFSCALALPLFGNFALGGNFLLGDITAFDQLGETVSLWSTIAAGRWQFISEFYSGLIWLLPLGLVTLLVTTYKRPTDEGIFFAVTSVFGSALLIHQIRLQYFGSFALYLPWLVVLAAVLQHYYRYRWPILGTTAVIFVLAHLPGLDAARWQMPPGNDHQYELTRDVYPILEEHCKTQPDIVLAEPGDGHYITYHTACSVISANFILTAQHERKFHESVALLAGTLDDALRDAPWVRYIYVRRADNLYDFPGCYPQCLENAGLRRELFAFEPGHDQRISLLFEKRIRRGDQEEPLLRLFKVER